MYWRAISISRVVSGAGEADHLVDRALGVIQMVHVGLDPVLLVEDLGFAIPLVPEGELEAGVEVGELLEAMGEALGIVLGAGEDLRGRASR